MVCMTTDSGANVVSALRVNSWTRLPCYGHRLHIAIEKSMRDPRIDRAIGVCKKVVRAFSNSWKMKRALCDAQDQLKLPKHKHRIANLMGIKTAHDRFIEQEKAIRHVLDADKKCRHLIPTWQDVDVLESVSKVLSPLLKFTDALSGEQLVIVSYPKPVLALFNSEVLAVKSDDTDLTKQIKTTILEYLNTKYKEDCVDDLLILSSTLDPRFKNRYNDDDQIKATVSAITSELIAMTVEDSPAPGPTTTAAMATTAEGGAGGGGGGDDYKAKKTKKYFGSYFKKHKAGGEEALATAIEKEVKSFLLIPEVDSDVNPLDWWKSQEVHFPRLGKIAKKYLCSPPERTFSTGENDVTCHQAALKPDTVDRLVFLAHNLK
ncbi:zinc finger BED domain-containing protein 1-like [Esox lucius]|uniref:zinc finger BED domain-containing protein 1-like n=1 Tax=Esox lucius TaxID=8010 RepID=UPI000973210C|nr:zinc finger BED domain-containing protein 1-like [Esox lucius]